MTEKEILDFCVRQYQRYYDAIVVINNKERMISLLDREKAASGVCLFIAQRLIGEEIPNWIKNRRNYFAGYKIHWYKKPFYCESVEEVVFAIKWRLDKLKELQNEYILS